MYFVIIAAFYIWQKGFSSKCYVKEIMINLFNVILEQKIAFK